MTDEQQILEMSAQWAAAWSQMIPTQSEGIPLRHLCCY